ncbi:putative rhamnose biosynthetic enzyme 1 [Tetrabaena socialis]|uniref:Putative rhamnose biosynthetic enzyme 1 n=1 Tax=Tetrabaena socialis TaxID=47790 RepID=A0A2J7ZUB1_9CHLO|nr:putative rhamnose biosynthetic enzyme 1 [Tetrabaena socialis]|eukprot:PNH03861.1 putative rhamnose biosynthetic enzyme 1 [Tetrabaena socialis]
MEGKHNFRVSSAQLKFSSNSTFSFLRSLSRVTSGKSMDLVSYILKTEEIDTVMHFAAQTHVDNSFGNSLAFTLNNTYARVRSYLYVDDVAEAFDCVLHKGVTGETYNIGTESERSVLDVACDIANVFSVNLNKVIRVKDRAFNDRRYYIGSSKLAALGWKESTSWEEGLKKTIDWYMGLKDMETYWVGDLEMALKPHPVAASGPVTAEINLVM